MLWFGMNLLVRRFLIVLSMMISGFLLFRVLWLYMELFVIIFVNGGWF